MYQQGNVRLVPWSDRLLSWTLTLLLLFTPLAFGTVEVWSIAVAELLVLFMGAIWFAQMIRDGRIQIDRTPFTVLILSFLALMLFQMIPLPPSTIKLLSPTAYSLYSAEASAPDLQMGWRTISLNPVATGEEFLKVLTYAMLFWILLNHFRERKQIERIIVTIIGIGFFLAVFAIIQKYSSNGKIYWIRETAPGGQPFGPYVNRNHFAGYMEIALPLTIGYILARSPLHTNRPAIRERLLLWTSQRTSKSILMAFAAIFMGAALLLTGSRGGLVSFAGSMAFFVVMAAIKPAARSRTATVAMVCCGFILIAAVLIGGTGAFLSLERLKKTVGEPFTDERAFLWRDTLRMANDYVRFGSGFNTFEEVFPAYKTSTAQIIFQYAHNDYLQLLAEGGIVAFGLAVWFIVAWYREVIARWLKRHDPLAVYLPLAGMTAVFAILIHSLTDFNLHIPANAIAMVTVLSITLNTALVAASGQSVTHQSAHDSDSPIHHPLFPSAEHSPGTADVRGENETKDHTNNGSHAYLHADTHGQADVHDRIDKTESGGMREDRINAIIARLAQPEPLPDLSALCPDRPELIGILLDIRRGLRSSHYAELRATAERQHLDVRHLVQKAETLLVSIHLASRTDYYAILGVDQNASAETVHEKWLEKMRVYHPDNYEDPTGWIAEQSWSLNEAYAVLKDPEKRREYDTRRKARMKGGLRAAGATDLIAPNHRIDAVSTVHLRPKLIPAIIIAAIAIASLIVTLLLWSL
ncbi:MAG TPA: O-antigen ligase family protein [Patescibacteria group bacterium]|nr:O-antigen ligase family protein [Patescibacteria group bacterium]